MPLSVTNPVHPPPAPSPRIVTPDAPPAPARAEEVILEIKDTIETSGETLRAKELTAPPAPPPADLPDGKTALHMAQSAEAVKLLVAAGADIHAEADWGNTPLHTVTNAGAAQALIDAGANLESLNRLNQTPLFHVEDIATAKTLIESGAKVNPDPVRRDKNHSTPLLSACRDKSLNLIKLLLDHGARTEVRDGLHHTPLKVALKNNNIELAVLLTLHGADPRFVPYDFEGVSSQLDFIESKSLKRAVLEARRTYVRETEHTEAPLTEKAINDAMTRILNPDFY